MQNNRIILAIVAAVFVWGTVLAIGAYRFNFHLGRFLIVQGCVLAFLVFWMALLVYRRKIPRRSPAGGAGQSGPSSLSTRD
jgi:high-affinity Fe2+/Pb2+ permease